MVVWWCQAKQEDARAYVFNDVNGVTEILSSRVAYLPWGKTVQSSDTQLTSTLQNNATRPETVTNLKYSTFKTYNGNWGRVYGQRILGTLGHFSST